MTAASGSRTAPSARSRRRYKIDAAQYAHIDHGYAVTVHKAQGATVDRAYVLASGGMDRHLAYVGLVVTFAPKVLI